MVSGMSPGSVQSTCLTITSVKKLMHFFFFAGPGCVVLLIIGVLPSSPIPMPLVAHFFVIHHMHRPACLPPPVHPHQTLAKQDEQPPMGRKGA